ncbi:TonB-dependent receptor [Hyphomicrobium sp.]|uniref:TonB-dependent receptor n=1 Tax=Hyphomicrobium sp. TaxID=82 RepID=UPI0025C00A62|nr:TonB-dependent receptor [Hyphomicrobium sp.]MCC7250623.1 TonB-dependent receptor [Hyphomicrobium sp.]
MAQTPPEPASNELPPVVVDAATQKKKSAAAKKKQSPPAPSQAEAPQSEPAPPVANAGASPVSGAAAQDIVNPITTTGSRTPTEALRLPYSTTVVTREEIEKSGAVRLDQVLRSVPGLQFGTQGNAYPRIATRGLRDTADVLVLIDGVPFRQLGGSADLTMLPVGIIERVEFVKGPASGLYGRSAIGGVLQIFTRPDSDTAVYKQKATVGSDNFRETVASGYTPLKGGAASIQAGISDTDGFQRNTDREAEFVAASVDRQITDWLTVGVVGQFSQVDAKRGSIIPLINGRPAFGITREDNFGLPGARFEGEYTSLSIPLKATLGNGWEVHNIFNVNRYDRFATGGITITPNTTPTNKGWSESDTRQEILQNDLIAQWNGGAFGGIANLSFGGNFETGRMDQASPSFSNQPTYLGPNFTTPVANAGNYPYGIRGATTLSDTTQTIGGVFAGLDYTWGPWSLFTGIRWDTFETTVERSGTSVVANQTGDKATKRFGTSYEVIQSPAATVAVFANYTEGFRPQLPALETSGGVTLPRLLEPEFTRSYEAGFKVSAFNNALFAEVTFFDMERVDAQRSFRVDADTFLFTNARQDVEGVEAQLRYRANDSLSGYFTYSYQDAVNTEFKTLTADYSGNTIRMAARHFAGAGFDWRFGNLNWNVSVNYVGERPLRDNLPAGQSQILPSYIVWNTSLRYEFDRYFAQATVNNIADEFYIADDFSAQNAGNAGPPREFLFTAGVRF